MRLASSAEEQAELAQPPLQALDTNSPAKRRSTKRQQQEASTSRAACTNNRAASASPSAKKTKQEEQKPEEQEDDPVNTSSSASSSPATNTAAAVDAVALAAEPSSLVVPPSAAAADAATSSAADAMKEGEAAAMGRTAEAEAQIQALFFDDDEADDDVMQEDGGGSYRYQPSARRVSEDKGEWRLVCSEDEGESEYETDSDLSSDDDDDDDNGQGPKRATKKGKKRRPLRLGPKTIGQLQAALHADPEWRGLAVLARFLRDGLSPEDDVEALRVEEDKEAVVPAAAAAMDVVAPVGAEGEEQPPAMAAAPTPSPTTTASEEAAIPAAPAVEKEEEEEEEEEGMDPEAAAEARAVMAWHLRPRPMCAPFKEEEMAAIQERARQLDANKKPSLEERRPPPYKKIRRLVFHESMKDRTHIFREDGQDAQCECVECAGAAPAQQEEQAGKKEKKGRGRSCAKQPQPQPPEAEQGKKEATAAGLQQQQEEENDDCEAGVLCGPGCINRSLHVECTPATCRFALEGRCRNQRITKREGKAFAVFRTEGRGWGVKASEHIRPGEFVMEYVGEVIDDEEVARRMWASKQAGAENYYMVEMNGATVDARDYGNEARFVNHACEPNCSLQKWLVDGSYRLALFSIKPITYNEEITWDYNFASFGEPKPCLCGAPNCRKVLAGKPQKEETPAPQLTAKGQQTQREAAAAEAFRRTVVLGKPLADVSDVVLFFNGRTSRGEMARARRRRLWLTADGPAASTATTKRRVLEQAVEVARDRARAAAAASAAAEGQAQEQQGGGAMAKIVAELEEIATTRRSATVATPAAHRALFRPCRRLGLLSLREKRLVEAATLGFAKSLLGEARVAAWPEERRAVVEDMVVFIRTSETAGLLTDLNEDSCYSCNCSGDLLCCDSCTAAYHLSCAGLWQLPEEAEWLCNRCKKGAARCKRDAKQRERATGGTRA